MTPEKTRSKNELGQIVVEYVLILVIVVAVLATVVQRLVQRKEGEEGGLIIRLWDEMLQTIGSDEADDLDNP